MTLKKLMIRFSTITDGNYDVTFKLKKMDDGDSTVDTVATASLSSLALASRTLINIDRSHFDNNPKFGIGDNAGISIQSGSTFKSSDVTFTATSVWETKIVL